MTSQSPPLKRSKLAVLSRDLEPFHKLNHSPRRYYPKSRFTASKWNSLLVGFIPLAWYTLRDGFIHLPGNTRRTGFLAANDTVFQLSRFFYMKLSGCRTHSLHMKPSRSMIRSRFRILSRSWLALGDDTITEVGSLHNVELSGIWIVQLP